MNENKIKLFLDSGAFSAKSQGVKIDIYKYIEFIKKYKKHIEVYANLDVIGDAEASLDNQKIMEAAGLSPLPCFHYGEPFKYLKYYIKNYNYIALGGMVGASSEISNWLDLLFSDYIPMNTKVHGFGMTNLKLMLRFPWFSVDSSSWCITGRMGSIYVPKYKNNKYIYDENSWKVSVSTRSPDKKLLNKHIETFSPKQKELILRYFGKKGYKLGKSIFHIVEKDYELNENERWNGKERIDGSREVETIIESGLCNNYKLRDELNIIYFLDLERQLPEWPWKFEKKGSKKGFGL